MTKISASLLAADPLRIAEAVCRMEAAGVDWLHVDVMDGHFVPNLNFGPQVVEALRGQTRLPLDVHLMLDEPERYAEAFVRAGADRLTVHCEIAADVSALLARIRALGASPGVSLKPGTPVEAVLPLLPLADMVLVMTVEPGFGGQKLIPATLEKLPALREAARRAGKSILLQVDGGIGADNARTLTQAGADVLVMGNALVRARSPECVVRAIRASL